MLTKPDVTRPSRNITDSQCRTRPWATQLMWLNKRCYCSVCFSLYKRMRNTRRRAVRLAVCQWLLARSLWHLGRNQLHLLMCVCITYQINSQSVCYRSSNTPCLKNWTPTIFQNNFAKTDQLSTIFSREDRYSFAYRLCRVKSLMWVDNNLRGFRNSITMAW